MPEDEKREEAENGTVDDGKENGGAGGPGGPQGEPPMPAEPEGGPNARQREFLEERHSVLGPKPPIQEATDDTAPTRGVRAGPPEAPLRSPVEFEPPSTPTPPPDASRGAPARADTEDAPKGESPGEIRKRALEAYRARQARNREKRAHEDEDAPPPAARGAAEPPQPPAAPLLNNWVPLGPSVLRKGQGATFPATSGRTPGIAVAPSGLVVYAAAANGGVWRSDDAGDRWRSLMDAFDQDPQVAGADSLACGAVAIDPANPDRVYVGTGEGAGGAYMGVGPVVSDDGGATWRTEPSSPSLLGSAFFALAVDPTDPEHVLGATRNGLYRREPSAGGGGYEWTQRLPAATGSPWFTSVVATLDGHGATVFYATRWYGPVFMSTDGDTWTAVGTGFPSTSAGRITLGVSTSDPDVVYALVANRRDELLGVWRLDVAAATWAQVTGVPDDLFGIYRGLPGPQGGYDQALAVDPLDSSRIYVGGSTAHSGGQWSGAIYRCDVSATGSGSSLAYQAHPTYIGASTHADIHTLVFTPGRSDQLWVGCDGGVYFSNHPTDDVDVFVPRNTGLATLTMNHMAQHPTEDAVLFCGTQDNGGARFTGEEAWLHTVWGDSGHFVIHWDDPYQIVATYVRNSVNRSTDGGARYSYARVAVPLLPSDQALFYAPLVGTPRNPVAPAEADRIAFGSTRPWISDSFGDGWYSLPDGTTADQLGPPSQYRTACIKSMRFASHARLYVGLMDGRVYRYDEAAGSWTRTRLDTVGGASQLPLVGIVTDIAMDPSDASGDSIYITLGGTGDHRHVWHFDGAQWEARSGPAAGHVDSLLDVQHNTIIVDPDHPAEVYVGADIGVWRSTDSGATWDILSDGLPDAGVLDLDLHENRRLLRASTHGRGVFEWALDPVAQKGVELFVRDTRLDRGRGPSDDGLPDPIAKGEVVTRSLGPDIRTEIPDASGNYAFPPGTSIDFLEFTDALVDDTALVATHATAPITSRVFVQVHNRGVTPADGVTVVLLVADRSGGMPPLPTGYETDVWAGSPIQDPAGHWHQVGRVVLQDVRAGHPEVAAFDLPSSALPAPSELPAREDFCVLALLHHASDAWTSAVVDPDGLVRVESKAAYRYVKVVQHVGTTPVAPIAPASPVGA